MSDPPYMEKNKLLLNEYLGDFMHFETLFFSENDLFQTHPPTKFRKNPIFFFFLIEPFPYSVYLFLLGCYSEVSLDLDEVLVGSNFQKITMNAVQNTLGNFF